MADLEWLRDRGFARALADAVRGGRPLLGLCGGYQMLGIAIRDPDGVESATAETPGLALLPGITTFTRPKRTVRVRARVTARHGLFAAAAGVEFDAYEIHAGRTEVGASRQPFALTPGAVGEGALNASGRVVGTYLHGLLENGRLRRALLIAVAEAVGKPVHGAWGADGASVSRYDLLADIVGAAIDMPAVAKIVGLPYPRG